MKVLVDMSHRTRNLEPTLSLIYYGTTWIVIFFFFFFPKFLVFLLVRWSWYSLSLPTLQGYGLHAPSLPSTQQVTTFSMKWLSWWNPCFLCSPINIAEISITSQDISCVSFPYCTLGTQGTAAISSFLNMCGFE